MDLVRPVPAAVLALVGAVFGWATSAAIQDGLPGEPYLAHVLGNNWAWVAVPYAAAWSGRSWPTSAARALCLLVPAVLVYYVADLVAGDFDRPASVGGGVDLAALAVSTLVFLVIGVVTAAGTALAVTASRRRGVVGLVGSLALPVYLVLDGSLAAGTADEVALRQVGWVVAGLGLAAAVVAIMLHRRGGVVSVAAS